MKTRGSAALTIGTPLIIALGLFLPDIVCSWQDGRTHDIVTFKTNQVHLDSAASDDASSVLKLLANDYTTIELDAATEPDAEQASAALSEALTFLAERGFDDITSALNGNYTEKPFLALSTIEGQAAKLWECVLTSKEDSDVLLLAIVDAISGKVVQLTATVEKEEIALTEDTTHTSDQTLAWAEAWADYLQLQNTTITEPIQEERVSSTIEDTSNITITTMQHMNTSTIVLQNDDVSLSASIGTTDQSRVFTICAQAHHN